MSDQTIARSLKDGAEESNPNGINFPGVSTKISFPFLDVYKSVPLDQIIDFYLTRIYEIGIEIWTPENLPDSWRAFIYEIIVKREEYGIEGPLNILPVAIKILTEDENALKKAKLILGDIDPEDFDFLLNKELIIKLLDLFFSDEELKQLLSQKLAKHIPYRSANWVEMIDVINFIKAIELANGVIIDLGCGTGEKTQELVGANRVIGIERLYYKVDFAEYWSNSKENINFVQADGEELPFKDHSVDLVNMTAVAGHLDTNALIRVEDEVRRVLKVGGSLLVGPQKTGDWRVQYRLFKLDNQNILKECSLSEALGLQPLKA